MQSSAKAWNLIHESLKAGDPVVLLFVLESQGSSPGRQGFAMAVTGNGQLAGSIGGGIMEHKFVELAKAHLAEEQSDASIHRQIHSKEARTNQSGMICSGEQTILLYAVRQSDGLMVEKLVQRLQANQPGWIRLSADGIEYSSTAFPTETGFYKTLEQIWFYNGPIGAKPLIHIIGGGHCSLALSRLMDMLGFRIKLYDDRPGLNTWEENQLAEEKLLLGSYDELTDILPSDPESYVVVMTFGYRTDDQVIRALKDRTFAFFGVLGSQKKIAKMMEDYRTEGFSEDWLQTLSAPVGVPIKSQTPEEIAVSIAAEIIARKNNPGFDVKSSK
ncbi:MAG TPA: XdhC family protein [Catalimonadaceae bacterium]|nr:XdhC family protein [Catalimonadaceae bacterium]